MQITKCNKCDFVSPDEKDFSVIYLYLPQKHKTFRPIGSKWDELTKKFERAELVYAGLEEYADMDEPHIVVHLCPKHTDWFAQQFLAENLEPKFVKKKKQKKIKQGKKRLKEQ